jgi:hypothetical protein
VYEHHGWFCLSENPEGADSGLLHSFLPRIQQICDRLTPPANGDTSNTFARLQWLNGELFLLVQGFTNRPRGDDQLLSELLAFLSANLPGSYGILYERDDERSDPPGRNAFRVRVLARGQVSERDDPFLSPCVPTIEG